MQLRLNRASRSPRSGSIVYRKSPVFLTVHARRRYSCAAVKQRQRPPRRQNRRPALSLLPKSWCSPGCYSLFRRSVMPPI